MIDAVTVETAHLFGDALPALHRLRHRIFVERQGYRVPTYRGMEWDTFDTPAAVYLMWRDDLDQVRAIARLIPTTFPYMIKELWPHLVDGDELPSRPDIWEVTRLGVDRSLAPAIRRRVFGALVCGCGEFGKENGIKEFYLVTHPKLIRSIHAAGCDTALLGKAQAIGTSLVAAARIPVTDTAMATLRATYTLPTRVLRDTGKAIAVAAALDDSAAYKTCPPRFFARWTPAAIAMASARVSQLLAKRIHIRACSCSFLASPSNCDHSESLPFRPANLAACRH